MAINGFLFCWYLLTFLSLIYLIYDLIYNTPAMWVMALAWGLVILYTGPIGLFFYLLSCRQPMPGTHEQFIQDHWKQALGSEIHCVAGDATAIIVTAGILHYFKIPNGTEAIIEYIAAYLFGLFIFQALFMRSMYSSYWEAVRQTIFPETVSMNLVMTGMIPVIALINSIFPPASNPERPYFWGMMTLATLAGFITAYPINSWLVRKGIKHGMMTRGMEHGKPHGEQLHEDAMHGEHSQHGHMQHTHTPSKSMHPKPTKLTTWQMWFHVIWTFALLIFVMWIVSFFIPIRFV